MKRLAIDPGHGLNNADPRQWDPGAIGGGVQEAIVVMDYANALAAECAKHGIPTWMSRAGKDDPDPLYTRTHRAVQAGCDVFISIHCNSAFNTEATGTETLYKVSTMFAARMQVATVKAMGLRDRGVVNRPNLAVLQFPGPCALVELGFISNEKDRKVLLDPAKPAAWAASLVEELMKDQWV